MNSVGVMPTSRQTETGLTERLRDLFIRVLGTEVDSADTDLIETGLLDSLALVNLILELEAEFQIDVSYDQLELDHFRTLGAIADFVLANGRGGLD